MVGSENIKTRLNPSIHTLSFFFPSAESFHKFAMSLPATFFVLPRELRDEIYKILLTSPVPLQVYQVSDRNRKGNYRLRASPLYPPFKRAQYDKWLSLLYTNKAISKEAAEALYRLNSFEFGSQSPDLRSFIDTIGPTNASHLRRLYIGLDDPNNYPPPLSDISVGTLQLLQTTCTNLRSLEIELHNYLNYDILPPPAGTWDRLADIDTHLKKIPSLREFSVSVYNRPLPPEVRDRMTGYGWLVVEKELPSCFWLRSF
ncbi:hypothetical protein V8F20_006456 [Naviculisporaceae sp. PSN 640]